MKELMCRGKATDFDPRKQGQWVDGYYTLYPQGNGLHPCILTGTAEGAVIPVFVEPESVGRFTGETDKSGVDICVGDIVKVSFEKEYGGLPSKPPYVGVVEFKKGAFGIYERGKGTQFFFQHGLIVSVIGNIHDNPELLR